MSAHRVDLHVKILDDSVVERAKRRGLDVLVYAPHFTRLPDVRRAAEKYSDDELLVVPAREIFTGTWRNRKHVLALDLTDPIPDYLTLEGTMAELDRQDAVVLIPHPQYLTFSLRATDIRAYRDQIDAVEIYNVKEVGSNVDQARSLARSLECPTFGSSYAHLHGSIGEVWTEFDREFDSPAALYDALRNGDPRRVYRRPGPSHTMRRALELGHLGWENTYEKLDRVLLSGLEPTHPHHIAYDGRFKDVAVY